MHFIDAVRLADHGFQIFHRQPRLVHAELDVNDSLLHVHAPLRVHSCATTLDLHVNGSCGVTSPVWMQDADFFGTEQYQPKMKHADSGLKGCTESV